MTSLYLGYMSEKFTPLLSYPKQQIRALLLENIHPIAEETFRREGYQVEVRPSALSEAELLDKVKDVHLLGIRSNTKLTKKVLQAAPHLHALGAYCIGTNQIDLDAARNSGIAVFNAPYSNTRSVVELAIAEMIALNRDLTGKNQQLQQGIWDKSAIGSHEIRGKRLGIIGYGNIGSQLSVLAESLGLQVYFYDLADRLRLGNARSCDSLNELLEVSDIVSIHVDGRQENANFFAEEQLGHMRQDAILLNLSRGFVLDIPALKAHLDSGHLAGVAIDVFPNEPKSKDEPFINPLPERKNVILTPHVGGSTEEAQENIGQFVADKLVSFINTGNTSLSVNFPNLILPPQAETHRLIHVHENVPGVVAQINQLFVEHDANLVAQYLGTSGSIGYVTSDINREYGSKLRQELKALKETIRLRVLY